MISVISGVSESGMLRSRPITWRSRSFPLADLGKALIPILDEDHEQSDQQEHNTHLDNRKYGIDAARILEYEGLQAQPEADQIDHEDGFPVSDAQIGQAMVEVIPTRKSKPFSDRLDLPRFDANDRGERCVEYGYAKDEDGYGQTDERVRAPFADDPHTGKREPEEITAAISQKNSCRLVTSEIPREEAEATSCQG